MSLLRLMTGVIVAILLVAAVLSWTRSHLAMDVLTHRYGTLREPGQDPEEPRMYTYTARSVSLSHRRGRMGVMWTRNKYLGASPADMVGYQDVKRWQAASIPLILVSPDVKRGPFEYNSIGDFNILGVRATTAVRPTGAHVWTFGLPHWLVCTLLAAALTKLLVIPWFRWRRGRCPRCAHDLRTITDGPCPNCGWGAEDHPTPEPLRQAA